MVVLLMSFSATMVPPMVVSLIYAGRAACTPSSRRCW
jgi:hypothetical protein